MVNCPQTVTPDWTGRKETSLTEPTRCRLAKPSTRGALFWQAAEQRLCAEFAVESRWPTKRSAGQVLSAQASRLL